MGNPWTDSDDYAREAAKVESAGEALLLTLLWWRRDGWTVRAQHSVEQYRIDLFIPEVGVAIEVDGFEGHASGGAMERDAAKRNLVVSRGWAPLTFSARQTLFRQHETLATVLAAIGGRLDARKVRAGGVVRAPRAKAAEVPLETAVEGGHRLLGKIANVPPPGEGAPVMRRRAG